MVDGVQGHTQKSKGGGAFPGHVKFCSFNFIGMMSSTSTICITVQAHNYSTIQGGAWLAWGVSRQPLGHTLGVIYVES